MPIDHNILVTYGGVARRIEKGAIIFHEGATPYFYYQVLEGSIKVFSSNSEGKELIQGVFTEGQSFGEPPLLLNRSYPSTAQAACRSVVIKIGRENLLDILKDYPALMEKMLFNFAERIYSKASANQVWVSHTPEEKIRCFLNNMKVPGDTAGRQAVPYTRQQIADFTGLRVETVIRTLGRMHKKGDVKIIDHKLFY